MTTRILLALLGGILTNIVVAMLFAAFLDHDPIPATSIVTIDEHSLPAPAAAYLNDKRNLSQFGPERATGLRREVGRTFGFTNLTYRRWHDHNATWPYSRQSKFLRFGLPFRSLQFVEQSWHSIASTPASAYSRPNGLHGGWPLSQGHEYPWVPPRTRIYPLLPIPLGFAANSLLYTIPIFLSLLALRNLRRRRRTARGLCPICTYPRGTTTICPECGMPHPPPPGEVPLRRRGLPSSTSSYSPYSSPNSPA